MSQQQPTVFIVDDNTLVRDSVSRLVRKKLDVPVEGFATVADFLGHEAHRRLGCLILDLRLPGINGFELLQTLRDVGSRLAVIVVSGHGDDETRVQVLSQGVVAYLEKPFPPAELLDTVRRALGTDND